MQLNSSYVSAPDVGSDITDLLQAAIDTVHASGGGQVIVPQGRWVSRAIRLKSRVDLHLPNGCELACSQDYDDFADGTVAVIAEDSDRAFIVARDADTISISGSGTIHGGGSVWCARPGLYEGTLWPKQKRPRMVVFENCTNVSLSGVTFREAPMWTVHLVACRHVRIDSLNILNDMSMPNTDGINLDSCSDAMIRNTTIEAADDAICVKTCRKEDDSLNAPAERILVSNCILSSRSCALKIGTETYQDIRDVVFTSCTITRTNRAFGIFSRDGGTIERIRFSNCVVHCQQTPDGFWGSGEPVTINALPRRPGEVPGKVRDIAAEGITGRVEGAINIVGCPDQPIENVLLANIQLALEEGSRPEALYLDLRPTAADVNGLDSPEEGRRNAWVRRPDGGIEGLLAYPYGFPGVWIEEATVVSCSGVQISRPDPLPETWSAQTIVRACEAT
ncbi:glycoside hydrolase family 28 protein [Roseibium sp. SCP14]|uniref:glycoside hydrolase family 28 protein n=1 Tax=Roseibium sp. SCP14 TaxID=3141375 RepID=UPI00333D9BE6